MSQNGNVLFIILIAIALIGALTVALKSSNMGDSANIDDESLAIKISEVRSYMAELERAVAYINQNGVSQDDIRFAHENAHSEYGDLSADADPSDQVFHKNGGGATYRSPPSGINDGSAWEFYGSSSIPGIGSSRADLIAVLPNVTLAFCQRINTINSQSAIPDDTGTCVNTGSAGRFDNATQYYSSPNTMDESTFAQDAAISDVYPAPQACVVCDDSSYNFYSVLLAR